MEGMATVKVQKGQTIVKQKDKVHNNKKNFYE